MKGTAVIGTSMLDLVVTSRRTLQLGQCNKSEIVRSFGGSMHNVAWNCAVLGLETHFVSKFGQDELAMSIIADLQSHSALVYGPAVNAQTPVFIDVSDDQKDFYLSSIQSEFLFHSQDEVPYCILRDCAWGIIDQADPGFLARLLERTPKTRWLFSGQIPPLTVAGKLEGVIVNRGEMEDFAQGQPMADAAKILLKTGLSWLLITLDKEGALLVTQDGIQSFASVGQGEHPLGCGDALCAGLLYGLQQGLDIQFSIPLGLKAAAEVLKEPSALTDKIRGLLEDQPDTAQVKTEPADSLQ